MVGRLAVSTACTAAALIVALAVPAMAADVTSLPATVEVNARDSVFVSLETNYDNPDTEDVEYDCTDTWATKVLSGAPVIKPIAAPECDGMTTSWSIGTRKGAKPKTTAIVEFTRTAPDGTVVSVQRLTVKVIVPKKAPAATNGGNTGGVCDLFGKHCATPSA